MRSGPPSASYPRSDPAATSTAASILRPNGKRVRRKCWASGAFSPAWDVSEPGRRGLPIGAFLFSPAGLPRAGPPLPVTCRGSWACTKPSPLPGCTQLPGGREGASVMFPVTSPVWVSVGTCPVASLGGRLLLTHRHAPLRLRVLLHPFAKSPLRSAGRETFQLPPLLPTPSGQIQDA